MLESRFKVDIKEETCASRMRILYIRCVSLCDTKIVGLLKRESRRQRDWYVCDNVTVYIWWDVKFHLVPLILALFAHTHLLNLRRIFSRFCKHMPKKQRMEPFSRKAVSDSKRVSCNSPLPRMKRKQPPLPSLLPFRGRRGRREMERGMG